MSLFLLKRLIQAFFIVIGVTLVTFALFHLVGGDPALHYAGKNASAETIQSLRHELGLDQSTLYQYGLFLKQTFTWDWGHSWANRRSVSQLVYEHLGASLSLTVPAYLLSVLVALLFALLAAVNQGGRVDRYLLNLCFVFMSFSFVVYVVFAQKVFAFDLHLFPVYGWNPSWTGRWPYVFLPCLIYAFAHLPAKILLFRASLFQELQQDYVRTARAKGLATATVYSVHILKNTALPILTLVMSQLPTLLTGSVLLEAYFGIPGLGGLLLKSIQSNDLPVIKALTVLGSLFSISFQFLHDVLAAALDRRWELSS